MKGDPVFPVACPKCEKKLMSGPLQEFVRGYENSTYSRQRAALFRHFTWAHPELGLREKSLLADEGIRRAHEALAQEVRA